MVDNSAKDIDIDHIIDKLLEVRGYSSSILFLTLSCIDHAQESKLTLLSKKSEDCASSQETYLSTSPFYLSSKRQSRSAV